MEVAVSINGHESQHLASQETLHLASQDFPASINHHLRRDTSPAADTPRSQISPQRIDATQRNDNMSSSSGLRSPTGLPPSPPVQQRALDRGVPLAVFEPGMNGQNHDRMETDDESDDSESGTDTPQNEENQPGAGWGEVDPSLMGWGDNSSGWETFDPEAMDTTPDNTGTNGIEEPSNLRNQQPISQPTLIPEDAQPSNPPDPLNSNTAAIAQSEHTEQEAGQNASLSDREAAHGEQETSPSGQQASTDNGANHTPTSVPPPQGSPTQSDESSRSGRSADEEEHPFWASFEGDESTPNEEELSYIQKQPLELDAMNHEHWEKSAFESLEDPEHMPSATGRISWMLKGFHGTPTNPNKETFMRSPSVLIDGYYWNIKVYPRGNEGTPLMSVYIECSTSPNEGQVTENADKAQGAEVTAPGATTNSHTSNNENTSESNLANPTVSAPSVVEDSNTNEHKPTTSAQEVSQIKERWEVPAQVLCVAYNPQETRVLAYDRSDHRFHDESPDWGWRRFHGPWNKLHIRERFQRRALLQNDTLCFTAYIRTIKDHTGALFWHAPSGSPSWDHYERLGLNRMLAGSAGSSAAVSALSTWLHLYPISTSIKKMQSELDDNYSERPLFDELEHWRLEFVSSTKERSHDINFESTVEMVDWYDTGDCEADVVAFWETLRRILSFEASGVKTMAEAKDLFEDILLLKQPDAGKPVFAAENHSLSNSKDPLRSQHTEPHNVQEAINLAATYKDEDDRVWSNFDGSKHELPAYPDVLQVELHRQHYDPTSRKWKKLSHKIKIDESVTLGPHKSEYTLFGMVVHSGSLESRDYCSILRPHGPGTRWIKYAGDKADRGVECLTTRQAVTAHEGGENAESTSAVAYIVTYVRTSLLHHLATEPKKEDVPFKSTPEIRKSEGAMTNVQMDQDDAEDTLSLYVYQSDLFEGHDNLGVFHWSERGSQSTRVMKIEVSSEITPAGIVDAIVKCRQERFPDCQEKYAMWFMNTLLNNAAMDSIMRAPQPIPFTDRPSDELIKLLGIFYGPCRIWLQVMPLTPEDLGSDSNMLEASTLMTVPTAEDGVLSDQDSSSQTNGQASQSNPVPPPEAATMSAPASPERLEQNPSEAATMTNEQPTTEASLEDVAMEGNLDGPAQSVPPPPESDAPPSSDPPPPAKPSWNPRLDTETLRNPDFVYIFLKFFDQDTQSLRGVRCFFTKASEKVGERLRSELSLAEDQPIDVYEERISSSTRTVSPDSRFLDIGGQPTYQPSYILIAQRRPSLEELETLKQAGKPATVPTYYSYLLYATDPAYLRPKLTTSYFSTPYYSGSLSYGRPHGPGTSISLSGDAYTGTFASGMKHGHGTMRYANGDTYIGSWANDEPEGLGEMVYAKTGNVYTGGFKKRKRHGKGVMRFEVADEEMRLCQICYEEEMDALFFDCGHVAACEGCARQVEDCPVCRRRVKAVCRIWMS